jgi:hypothetical protein
MYTVLYTFPDQEAHDVLCDAFLLWGGYIIWAGELHEIRSMAPQAVSGQVQWILVAARIAGAA